MKVAQNITELIGKTPMVRLNRLAQNLPGAVIVKMESFNPMSSVKDRIGYNMVLSAEASGTLKAGGTIIEATSGNTGIALAFVGAARGYKIVLTMPDTMSIERRKLLASLGAELVLTPGSLGMKGAVSKAEEILSQTPGAIMARQFSNPANPEIHYKTTAQEIWADTDGQIDVFVSGVGTGGTITGVGRFLKEKNPKIEVIAVEPDTSPVLAGGQPGPHKIQGIGAGFIPDVLDRSVIDRVIAVSAEKSGETARRLAAVEGILGGISAGGNVRVALDLAALPEYKGKNIVTVLCDTGERYLSTWLFGDNQ